MSDAMANLDYASMTIDEKIAALDASLKPAPLPPRVLPSDEDTGERGEPDDSGQSDRDTIGADHSDPTGDEPDVIAAMQQLLLRHEDTQLHKVEDPDLVRALDEIKYLAHSNIADLYESSEHMEYVGIDDDERDVYKPVKRLTLKDITTLPREISACIQSVKVTSRIDGDVVEVKLYDKHPALDKLMKYHGAYVKDNEQKAPGDQGGIMNLLMASIGSQGMPTIENNDA